MYLQEGCWCQQLSRGECHELTIDLCDSRTHNYLVRVVSRCKYEFVTLFLSIGWDFSSLSTAWLFFDV